MSPAPAGSSPRTATGAMARRSGFCTVYGSYSSYKYAKPVPAKPTPVKATRTSSKSIRVTWGEVGGATRYQVYRATSNTGLKSGKYYYYKVRAYHLEGGTRMYGTYSTVAYAKP